MIEYLKKIYKKLSEDVLTKANYEVWGIFLVVIIAYVFISKNYSITEFLKKEIVFSIFQFGIIIFSVVTTTILIYFFLNKKRFNLIKYGLQTDELTGLPNHRALAQDLRKAIDWANSKNEPFSIILMDIDDFKNLNTEFGLKVADQ